MKSTSFHLGLAVLSLGSIAVAQTPNNQGKPQPKPATAQSAEQAFHVYKLSHIVGLNLKNDADKTVGEVEDVLINCADGRLVYAVVSTGGVAGVGEKDHLVPWESVRCTRKDATSTDCVGHTALTEEQISKAPVYKKGEPIDTLALDRAASVPGAARSSTCLISANELKGANVRSADKSEFGEIDDVVFAPEEGCVAYTVLASGGVLGMVEKKIALPWKTTEISRDAKDPKEIVVRTTATKAQLEKAPEFVANDWNRMSSRAWIGEVCTYYSADPFWTHARSASAPKEPENKH
ncbi:MAG: PRC-barrel domain-containing protein [Planctomycetes bacterium]|nr:PRC-barrel domain-containing protein [Planctomycetota bacterium]